MLCCGDGALSGGSIPGWNKLGVQSGPCRISEIILVGGGLMTSDREHMEGAIKRIVVPAIRALKFSGSLPHFRRKIDEEHQMLMIFFNKYGGSFYLEAGRVPGQRVRELQQYWANAGKALGESSLTVGHCHPNQRARLGPSEFSRSSDGWFVFGPDSRGARVDPDQPAKVYDDIALRVVSGLKEHAGSFFEGTL